MSWLYLPELVVESSGGNSSDGDVSQPSKKIPTAKAFYSHGKPMEFSRFSRFGMTLLPLTDDHGEALLTSYLAGFHAKTSALPEKAPELTAIDPGSGNTWHELSMKFDPKSSGWKTHRCLFDEDLPESSVILPQWGMMHDGVLSERMTPALHITGKESGYWPTPVVSRGENYGNEVLKLPGAVKAWATPAARDGKGSTITKNHPKGFNRNLANDVKIWNTPTVNDAQNSSLPKSQEKRDSIIGQIIRGGNQTRRMYLTPCANDNRDRGNMSSLWIANRRAKRKQIMLSQTVSEISGALNPEWVEWLMGWPIGWTDLKPLETVRFQQWQRLHGGF
jgi:hypothetical protein